MFSHSPLHLGRQASYQRLQLPQTDLWTHASSCATPLHAGTSYQRRASIGSRRVAHVHEYVIGATRTGKTNYIPDHIEEPFCFIDKHGNAARELANAHPFVQSRIIVTNTSKVLMDAIKESFGGSYRVEQYAHGFRSSASTILNERGYYERVIEANIKPNL
jgi:hypothetical protein